MTAGGNNFNGCAVAMARQLGLECPDRILSGYMDSWTKEDYEEHEDHLPEKAMEENRGDVFRLINSVWRRG